MATFVRISCGLALVAGAAVIPAGGGAAAPDDGPRKLRPASRTTVGKAPTSRLARTDRSLLDRSDGERIPVLVKLDYDAVASYAGGLPGLPATSPAVTGARLRSGDAERAYEQYLAERERSFTTALAARVPQARVGQRLRTVYGGVALTLPANQVKQLLAVEGVVAVQRDELREPLTDASSSFIGADVLQSGAAANGAPTSQAGKGVIVGVLDTGAWPEHPSFADQGVLAAPPAKTDGAPRRCDFGDNPLTPARDVFRCNNKLIGGAPFLDAYLESFPDETYKTARDSDGHGTHTASTAAGNVVTSAKVFGVERGPVHGVSPGSWVSVYKVCGKQGCMSSDSAAAVAQAVRDGVDVVNFSISGGTDPFSDPVEMAFLDAYAAGVFVAASAGNSGPEAGTVNHLSPWVTTVAASTQRREFSSALTLQAGAVRKVLHGASLTGAAGPAPVVRAGDTKGYKGGMTCAKPAKKGLFTGKIVVCERGGNPRVEKGWNVLQGGALGMVLYNPELQDVETDNHWLPTVHLPDAALLEFLDANTGITATIGAGEAGAGTGDVMAAFSSRGPGGLALKPDVTAPGVQILAGHTPTPDEAAGGPKGELFQAIAGTSMSSPHVAGAAALLAARHPGWTPGELKSALMTSAVTDVVTEDGKTEAGPQEMGAGRIAVDRADEVTLTVSDTADRMMALAGDEVRAVDLNLPSINAPVMPGRLTTVRTLRDMTGRTTAYDVSTTAPKDSAISVPPVVVVPAGGTATLPITVSSRATGDAYLSGEVMLTPQGGGRALHLPVSFKPGQGQVTLASTCTTKKVALAGTAKCTVTAANTGYDDAPVDLVTRLDPALALTGVDGSARAAGPREIRHTGTLRGIEPGRPGLADLDDRVWRPLTVPADPIGDEEIINYEVPEFGYGGQTYTRLGVVSNGYLVVGGGTGQDVRFEPPTADGAPKHDPARPNNVLAPYWADLDGTKAEGVRAATVKGGGIEWIVIEWRVNRFGTKDGQRFQVWLATGPDEDVRFAYDRKDLPGGAKTFAVGAENALGKGELRTTRPGPDLRVRTTDGKPGGTASYTVHLRALLPADARITTTMTSPEVPGTTVVRTKIPITTP
ncbi:S8 family serine peptidase [Catellatospora bangladeshensis]|uniref:Peptidase S8 n=1 Tax=Catellatospora bangladeshensis TaxID=310355 RepID=A0A8J3JAP3_9ACTN|nr:S8 family serine peptidase [Catellatospora bangladeshensis]GIF81362.1 peptidase S8 [Catellatospora bangladeshensis]